MKKISFLFAALAAIFMLVSAGFVSADEITVSDLVSETRIVDDTNEIIEKGSNGFVATEVGDYTIAELVTPPAEEPIKPVVPEADQPEEPSTPVDEKPVDPAPIVEKPELPVKPTPTPVVEKPEIPAEPTPTPVVEVPELPITSEPTPEPTPTPVRSEQKMVELPYTGTQESVMSLVLAAVLLVMAGYIKKEFAE